MSAQKRTHKKRKLTIKLVSEAIEKNCGNISSIARSFRLERKRIYEFVEKNPELKEEIEKAREVIIEEAENYLLKNIKAGKETSIIFALKTLGKKRGYIEKSEVEHSGEISSKVTFVENLEN